MAFQKPNKIKKLSDYLLSYQEIKYLRFWLKLFYYRNPSVTSDGNCKYTNMTKVNLLARLRITIKN
jgi:hypothetical protein